MFKVRPFPMLRLPRSSFAKRILLISFLAIFLLSLVVIPGVVSAQPLDTGLDAAASTGLGNTDLKVIIANIIRIILGFLGLITVGLIIYAGFVWMTAGGDESRIERAKKILVEAIIGLIIILAAFIIVSFILGKFNNAVGGPGNGYPDGPDPFGPTSEGPIASTYPAKGQKDVPINTMIFVTFKQEVDPTTICKTVTDGKCENSEVQIDSDGNLPNVEICQLDPATESKSCVANTEPFSAESFVNMRVTTNDNRTFGFLTLNADGTARAYLGLEDLQDRDFQVTLRSGIRAMGKTDSIFKGHYLNSKYSWKFTTNGELDLDPPEIQSTNVVINNGFESVGGVTPGPDNLADLYAESSPPTSSTFTFERGTGSPNVNVSPSTTAIIPDGSNASGITVSSSGTYGGITDGHFKVYTTNGAAKTGVVFTAKNPANPVNDYASSTDYRGANTIFIGPYGLTFNITGGRDSLAGGPNSWEFDAFSKKEGDRLQLLQNGRVLKTYILGIDIGDNNSRPADVTPALIAARVIATNPSIFESCGTAQPACVKTKATGSATADYSFKFLDRNTDDVSPAFSVDMTAGVNVDVNITRRDKTDAYRNTVFQINFNEAINPLEIDKIVVAYSSSGTVGPLVPLDKSDIQYEVSNEYRTVELMGKIECGVNACGDKIYCWPVNAVLDPNRDGIIENSESYANKATKYQLSLSAANVQKCTVANEGWCTAWGGTCAVGAVCSKELPGQQVIYPATSNLGMCTEAAGGWCKSWDANATCAGSGACVKTVAPQQSLYPTANFNSVDGFTDAALNSFNGSFNYYRDDIKGKHFSIANGPINGYDAGDASTYNVRSTYDLNLKNPYYNPNDPSRSGGFGDNFRWSFYISDTIDLQSPLLRSLGPIGDAVTNDEYAPANFTFNKLMRGATLKIGYNYGETAKDQSKRYLLLDPVTVGAWPIGYSAESDNPDTDGDGVSDYTYSNLTHSSGFQNNHQYSALGGSGLESITQNCFLPGSGPLSAGNPYGDKPINLCNYTDQDGSRTEGCVTDADIDDATRILKTNPASWAALSCKQIVGAVECQKDKAGSKTEYDQDCKILYYDSNDDSTKDLWGSWVITKDHATANADGRTGCCFGKCVSK